MPGWATLTPHEGQLNDTCRDTVFLGSKNEDRPCSRHCRLAAHPQLSLPFVILPLPRPARRPLPRALTHHRRALLRKAHVAAHEAAVDALTQALRQACLQVQPTGVGPCQAVDLSHKPSEKLFLSGDRPNRRSSALHFIHGRYSIGLLGVRPLGRDFRAEARTPTGASTVKRFGRSPWLSLEAPFSSYKQYLTRRRAPPTDSLSAAPDR